MVEAGASSRPATGERLLVVGPSWVGDMVMAQSLLMTLKARHPGCRVGVVAPAWSRPILERMAEVDEVVSLATGHGEFGWRARRALAGRLRGRFDRAIVLPRSWKSALVPFLAGIPRRTGFTGEQRYGLLNDRRRLDKAVLDQTVKRFVALGLPEAEAEEGRFAIPRPRLAVDADNLVALRLAHGLSPRPAIGMMPGAEYGPAKQWPLAYFRELAGWLTAEGFEVRVLGGPKDAAAGETIGAGQAHVHNLCGRTRLADAVDLLALKSGDRVGLDLGYRLCAQCHSAQAQAWAGGGHGKRLDGWQGRRVVMGCSDCHDPHRPATQARIPFRAPTFQRGVTGAEKH